MVGLESERTALESENVFDVNNVLENMVSIDRLIKKKIDWFGSLKKPFWTRNLESDRTGSESERIVL